ncbi:MAG: hypothetical protein R2734_11405 [Nocardioides sp.]
MSGLVLRNARLVALDGGTASAPVTVVVRDGVVASVGAEARRRPTSRRTTPAGVADAGTLGPARASGPVGAHRRPAGPHGHAGSRTPWTWSTSSTRVPAGRAGGGLGAPAQRVAAPARDG